MRSRQTETRPPIVATYSCAHCGREVPAESEDPCDGCLTRTAGAEWRRASAPIRKPVKK